MGAELGNVNWALASLKVVNITVEKFLKLHQDQGKEAAESSEH